jgi:hypothetical protein
MNLLTEHLRVPVRAEGLLEVVIGLDSGIVEGAVINDRQTSATNVKVVLVPEPSSRHRFDLYKSTTTDFSGAFRISGIPPGDYKAFAWEEVADGIWMNAEFLRFEESRGVPVRVAPERSVTVSLNAIPPRR